jgi:outer membrane protein
MQNIEVARSGHWPSLDLNADHSYGDDHSRNSGDLETTRSTISLDLTAPIYQGGQVSSQTREAAQRYSASLQNADTVRRNIERRVRDAYNTVITSKNQVTALLSAVKAAENALQARQQSFESGLSTNVEVLDATRDLYSAQRDLLRSRYNYISSMFSLKSLAGILSEEDFKQTSDLLTR